MIRDKYSMIYNLTVSIVLYKTEVDQIKNILEILLKSSLKIKIYFIDNSPTNILKESIPDFNKVEYHATNKNIGFGSAHNIAIERAKYISEFHLILNADVDFEVEILEEIYAYMKEHAEVGLLAPKVFNPDNTVQYSVKLLPSPINLIVRRFFPFKAIKDKFDYSYEFRFFNFDKIIEIPYATGCFMCINTKVFKKVKGFDEGFFMYPEDIDLTRRIHGHFKTIYYPQVSIFHKHGRGSYKSYKLLFYHVTSMIKYFNKWGWVFDKERREINKRILSQFR